MSTAVMITAIIVLGIVVVVFLAAIATPVAVKRSEHPCYFQGVYVTLRSSDPRKIGAQDCSGPAEYSYAVQPTHPAYVLQGVKVCPAHVGALSELVALLGDETDGYWIVPGKP